MRYFNDELYDANGNVVSATQRAWVKGDYQAAIQGLEGQITQRRLREAIMGVAGAAQWLAAKESEIAALRLEMAALS